MSTAPLKYYTSLRPKGITLKQFYDYRNLLKNEKGRETKILSGQKFLVNEIPARINYIHNRYYNNEIIMKKISHYSIDRLFNRFNSICSKFFDITKDSLIPYKDIFELDEMRETINNDIDILFRSAKGIIDDSNDIRVGKQLSNMMDNVQYTMIGVNILFDLLKELSNYYNDDKFEILSRVQFHNLEEIIQYAYENSSGLCLEKLGEAPTVNVKSYGKNTNFDILCDDSHLHFILFEILKNSMSSQVSIQNLSPIEIGISSPKGKHVYIKISDQGGGIDPKLEPFIFNYFFTTTPEKEPTYTYSGEFGVPLKGLGVGLPLARLYTKYLGGSIKLMSLYGQGTDILLTLNKHGTSNDFIVE